MDNMALGCSMSKTLVMKKDISTEPQRIILFYHQNEVGKILPLNEEWEIVSTGRNEKGRTPFLVYRRSGRVITLLHGEKINSKTDIEKQVHFDEEMAAIKLDSRNRQIRSEQSAANMYVD